MLIFHRFWLVICNLMRIRIRIRIKLITVSNPYPDPADHFDVDLDPHFQFDAVLCGSGSATLLPTLCLHRTFQTSAITCPPAINSPVCYRLSTCTCPLSVLS